MPTSADTRKQRRKLSKREADAYSREMMKVRWAEKRRRRIRHRVLLATGLVTAGALVTAGVVLELDRRALEAAAGPANMRSDGIVLTGDGSAVSATSTDRTEAGGKPVTTAASVSSPDGVVPIVLYLDYGDPDSAAFGAAQMEQISQWLTAGYVTLEIHPIAGDAASDGYSARAANALACVADSAPDSFLDVSTALLTAASKDGFEPPADDQLVLDVQSAGVADQDVADCITSHRFAQWVEAATARAETAIPNADVAKVTTTPLALVAKTSYPGDVGDADAFATFISDTYTATQSTAG